MTLVCPTSLELLSRDLAEVVHEVLLLECDDDDDGLNQVNAATLVPLAAAAAIAVLTTSMPKIFV